MLKALVNHKDQSSDITQTHYVRLSPEQLRPHLEAIHRAMSNGAPEPEKHRMRIVA